MKKYHNISLYLICCFVSSLLLYSCTSARSVNLLQDKNPVYTSKVFKEYKLQYNDEIYCTIYTSNTDFSDSFNGIVSAGGDSKRYYTIFENGNISIPYFGDIHVVGSTLREAEELIQNKMRQAIPDAQVKVGLGNNHYYIVSEEKNGQFEVYKDNMTIYQALAFNGSPSSRIDLSKVKIVRTNESGRSTVKTFDLRSESVIESEYYYIKPNDIIYYSTSKGSFFKIDSFSSLLSTLALPMSVIATVLAATRIK